MTAGRKTRKHKRTDREIQQRKDLHDLIEGAKEYLTPEVDRTLVAMKNGSYTAALMAARECFGIGKKRLIRFAARMDEIYDEMGTSCEKWEIFFDSLLKETGLKETDFVREEFERE